MPAFTFGLNTVTNTGIRIRALIMLSSIRIVRRRPISDWNFMFTKIMKKTPASMVDSVKTIVLPVVSMATLLATA